MPQYLPTKVEEDFGGLDCVSTPDAVRTLNTPDSRNDDISQPGSESKRNGFVKTTTTAYANAIYHMIQVKIKDITYTAYIDASGNMVTI